MAVKFASLISGCTPLANLISLKWRKFQLRTKNGVLFKLNIFTVCQWWQFPLKLHVASSVHKVTGETVRMIATRITEFQKFKLWAKQQLYVLFSRVRGLRQNIFLSDKLATMRSLDKTLVKENHLFFFISNLLESYKVMKSKLSSAETFCPVPLLFSEKPNYSFGLCLLSRSSNLPQLFYVGRCKNLRQRSQEH